MAKKPEPNKTHAVTEYLKANPQAKPVEIAGALSKKGIAITPGYAANIKNKINNGHKSKTKSRQKNTRSHATEVVVPVIKPPTKPSEAITLEQIRKVAKTIKAVGGFVKLHELLGVIQDVGGLEQFKELLAAMSATDTNDVPF